MKAILCSRYCGPDDLELRDLPDPVAAAGEAVVRVRAAALNFFDTLIIAGKYQTKPAFPFSPAAEFAGEVESVGAGVTTVRPGDRVVANIGFGAAREKVAIAADRLVRVPDGLDFERAAGLIVTYGTTLYALRERAQLTAGETLAVLGAAGGVGIAAVEIGKLLGARVIACASSAEKLAFAQRHGADVGVNYAEEDIKDALRRVTRGDGPHVIYDPVGGRATESALRAIAWGGRFLVVGFAAGEIPKLPLNLVLLKGCDVRGVFWGAWTERDAAGNRANIEQILQWCADGRLSAHVHQVFELEHIAQALHALADRKAMGKVILRI
jgi:NADPH2:quinone reductase